MGRKPKAATMEAKPVANVKTGSRGRPRKNLKVVKEARPARKPNVSKVAEQPGKTKRKAADGKQKKSTDDHNGLVRRSGRVINSRSSQKIQAKEDAHAELDLNVEPVAFKPDNNVGSPMLKSCKMPFATDQTTLAVDYKTLYVESQKEIEALTEQNYEHDVELSYERGKVNAFEFMIGCMKKVAATSSTIGLPDAEVNLSSETATYAETRPQPSPITQKYYARRLKKCNA